MTHPKIGDVGLRWVCQSQACHRLCHSTFILSPFIPRLKSFGDPSVLLAGRLAIDSSTTLTAFKLIESDWHFETTRNEVLNEVARHRNSFTEKGRQCSPARQASSATDQWWDGAAAVSLAWLSLSLSLSSFHHRCQCCRHRHPPPSPSSLLFPRPLHPGLAYTLALIIVGLAETGGAYDGQPVRQRICRQTYNSICLQRSDGIRQC
ncbi:hypothetical protein BJV77DRAFT_486319 [Russula vinacea]|nr:hypothetical protein BJV77DRAFT_486319 [Russula vinacea]